MLDQRWTYTAPHAKLTSGSHAGLATVLWIARSARTQSEFGSDRVRFRHVKRRAAGAEDDDDVIDLTKCKHYWGWDPYERSSAQVGTIGAAGTTGA